MAEANVNVTEGSGKRLHAWDRIISATTVLDEFTLPGEYPYPTYTVLSGLVSIATANDHILCLNAGASLNVRVRRIRIEQGANATAVGFMNFEILRTTTAAPTGGTAVTPGSFDTADAAAGATGRTLPTAKGTESTKLLDGTLIMRQALSATQTQPEEMYEWTQLPNAKPIVIAAGTTNGLVIKSLTGIAAATVRCTFEFVETSFL